MGKPAIRFVDASGIPSKSWGPGGFMWVKAGELSFDPPLTPEQRWVAAIEEMYDG